MFDSLNKRLSLTVKKLRGETRLTVDNIEQTLREVRRALLEADVALPVIQQFLQNIREQCAGQKVADSLSPGQQVVKIIHQQLIDLLGKKQQAINFATQPPAVILMAGLQGVGKTTNCAKLAKKLSAEKKKVLLASCDVYRPAAIEQLRILAEQCTVDFFQCDSQDPIEIAKQAKQYAKQYIYEVLIVDTAGRLNVDEQMMTEIAQIQQLIEPIETLFVVDSQQGQDAVNVAKTFAEKLPLTGLIFTKVDGDARGGAILSVAYTTGKAIKLLSTGEKLDDMQDFHPDRIASRILGMGDMLGLIEQLEKSTDVEKSKRLAGKVKKGGALDFNDMLEQFQQVNQVGGMESMLDKLPGMGKKMSQALQGNAQMMDEKSIKHQMAIILSMTTLERADPLLLKGSRRKRIANGSGTSIQQVNALIKQQKEMKGMMKKMKNKNFARQMSSLMGGQMPTGRF